MAMRNCFQVTSSSCKVGISAHCTTHSLASADKLNFPSYTRRRDFNNSLATLPASKPRRSHFICRAQEALDQGIFPPLSLISPLLLRFVFSWLTDKSIAKFWFLTTTVQYL
ncbi:unnamed protein product [Linum tenue]|uniref:Uncharacterized protein n=1 Tax=Linum tenue TaxID=586396 RepID=A0AAV0RX00_9ROSI|nr:unnamed protein product [Linum tenue]